MLRNTSLCCQTRNALTSGTITPWLYSGTACQLAAMKRRPGPKAANAATATPASRAHCSRVGPAPGCNAGCGASAESDMANKLRCQ